MKKKSFTREYKTTAEMDKVLESEDLSKDFEERGIVKKPKLKKINLDLPDVTVQQIDRIAAKLGVSRQPLLKIWIHDRLKTEISH